MRLQVTIHIECFISYSDSSSNDQLGENREAVLFQIVKVLKNVLH